MMKRSKYLSIKLDFELERFGFTQNTYNFNEEFEKIADGSD